MPLPPSLSVQVCRKGRLLDPNQAALLRMFGIKMASRWQPSASHHWPGGAV